MRKTLRLVWSVILTLSILAGLGYVVLNDQTAAQTGGGATGDGHHFP